MTETILKVDGMACGMCESHINDTVRNKFSVQKVTSSHTKGETVILSEQPLDQQALRDAIAATGYTVTANYTGEVAKTGCSVVTYTAIFGSMEAPEDTSEPVGEPDAAPVDISSLKGPLLIGGMIVVLAAGGMFVFKKIKERR